MNDTALLEEELLATKLFVPQATHTLLSRPHLASLLDQCITRPLTLVLAPAGFGKTTLVANWLSQQYSKRATSASSRALVPNQFAWLSLEESDNQPVRFWRYVVTALDSCHPGLADLLLPYLDEEHAAVERMLAALMNMVLAGPELVLILDDYHVIHEPSIHAALTFLLEHIPPNLHLVLITRNEPPLQLARLRARGYLLVISSEQLRCSLRETGAFFGQVMGVQLDDNALSLVTARTEGWLVGLQLIGIWLREHSNPAASIADLHGSHHYIFDYLIDEVVKWLSPDTQAFLFQTSILERFSAPLCAEVVEAETTEQPWLDVHQAQTMLEVMEKANLFVVPLDSQRRWYRYHHLFAEALRYRLEQLHERRVQRLHQRASRWYAKHGQIEAALQHSLCAQAFDQTATLLEQPDALNWGLAFSESHDYRRMWLERLPVDVVRSHPRLCLIYAQSLVGIVAPSVVEMWLDAAEVALNSFQVSDEAEHTGLRGELTATRAYHLVFFDTDTASADALCKEARTLLATNTYAGRALVAYTESVSAYYRGDAAQAVAAANRAYQLAEQAGGRAAATNYYSQTPFHLLFQGRLRDAWNVTEQTEAWGIELDRQVPTRQWKAAVALYQAEVLYEWNQLDAAEEQLAVVLGTPEHREYYVFVLIATTIKARIAAACADWSSVTPAVDQLLAMPPFFALAASTYIASDLVRLWMMQGDVPRATQWLAQMAACDAEVHPLAAERIAVGRVRLALAQFAPDVALAELAPLLARATEGQRLRHIIELMLLQSLAYKQARNMPEALATLREAVRLGEPEGFVRVFADEGKEMVDLLNLLHVQEKHTVPYLEKLLAAFPIAPVPHRSQSIVILPGFDTVIQSNSRLIEPLSVRELEVLHLVAEGASNQVIADTLVITINTAKRHMGNILAKLDVTNRTQAVARARALGLLSSPD